jgi:hypothetical protein
MEQSASWKAKRSSHSQQIIRILHAYTHMYICWEDKLCFVTYALGYIKKAPYI